MNLIEQLGGYEMAKQKAENALANQVTRISYKTKLYINGEETNVVTGAYVRDIKKALLEYRRQHNIFEVGDLITHPVFWGLFQVKETMKHHVLGVTSTGYESKLAMELIRHAEPEEIKAGKRLEVK